MKQQDESADRPDVLSIMAEIRKRVKENVEAHKDSRGEFAPSIAKFDGGVSRKAGELLYSEELRYLNTHYAYSTQLDLSKIVSHRGGIVGKAIVAFKRKILRIIWDSLLRDYFVAEKEFQANTVRFLNDVSKYLDARDAQNFWELVRKIDYDVTKVLERVERISDEQMASLRSGERRVTDELNEVRRDLVRMRDTIQEQKVQVDEIDRVARGLEGIVAKLKGESVSPPSASISIASEGDEGASVPDFSYLLLENRFRGSEEEISKRLEIYPPVFSGATKKVLELGPGRGELQLLFKNANIPSYGVDLDTAMVNTAREKGLECFLGDGIAHLRTLEDGSLGGVIAIQVVEHLPRVVLQELLTLAAKKVAKGGRVVFETINPQSVLALSSNYFRDPTHVWPQHPDTLSYAMTLAGLKIVEVRKLSPVPEGARLQKIAPREFMTPRWIETLDVLNRNIDQLNGLLYGDQDFCVIGEV